jgi:hypothetical protein
MLLLKCPRRAHKDKNSGRMIANCERARSRRIGTKLWRTDQASLEDYISTGQHGRYRRHRWTRNCRVPAAVIN